MSMSYFDGIDKKAEAAMDEILEMLLNSGASKEKKTDNVAEWKEITTNDFEGENEDRKIKLSVESYMDAIGVNVSVYGKEINKNDHIGDRIALTLAVLATAEIMEKLCGGKNKEMAKEFVIEILNIYFEKQMKSVLDAMGKLK